MANSPDWSPIETLWAWVKYKLQERKSIEELKVALEEIRQSNKASMLHNYTDQVPDLNSDYIGMRLRGNLTSPTPLNCDEIW